MTKEEAKLRIAMHAGRTEGFTEGYRYAMKFGFKNVAELQSQFDDLLMCMKELEECFYSSEIQRELLADIHEILFGSILYVNNKERDYVVVQVLTEVLAETMTYLLENVENPFEVYDNYKVNYDNILVE